jgi:hypothetical protein
MKGTTQTCSNCRFVHVIEPDHPYATWQCRRRAPIASPDPQVRGYLQIFPEVSRTTWCGDWQAQIPKDPLAP